MIGHALEVFASNRRISIHAIQGSKLSGWLRHKVLVWHHAGACKCLSSCSQRGLHQKLLPSCFLAAMPEFHVESRFRTKLHGIETFFYMKADHFHCPLFYCTSLQLHHPLFCITAFCTCKLNSKVYSRVLDCVKQMSSTASAFSKQIVAASDTSDIRAEPSCKMSWCRCSLHAFVRISAFRTSQRVSCKFWGLFCCINHYSL